MAMLHSWILSHRCELLYLPLQTVSVTIKIWPVIAVQLQHRSAEHPEHLGAFCLVGYDHGGGCFNHQMIRKESHKYVTRI